MQGESVDGDILVERVTSKQLTQINLNANNKSAHKLIKTLVEQGYERLNINSEDELISNLRKQLEKLNNYHFTDGEWDYFFTKIIANIRFNFFIRLSPFS